MFKFIDKNNLIPKENINLPKIEIYNNYIKIINYKKIIKLDSKLIILKNIKVEGINLKISNLFKDYITVKGNIKKIEFGEFYD